MHSRFMVSPLQLTCGLYPQSSPPNAGGHHAPSPRCPQAASGNNRRCKLPPRAIAQGGSSLSPRVAEVHLKLMIALRATGRDFSRAVFVNAAIEILEVGEIRRKKPLDDCRIMGKIAWIVVWSAFPVGLCTICYMGKRVAFCSILHYIVT